MASRQVKFGDDYYDRVHFDPQVRKFWIGGGHDDDSSPCYSVDLVDELIGALTTMREQVGGLL